MEFPSYDLLDTPDPDESAVIVYVQTKDLRQQHLPVAGVTTLRVSELTRDGIAISNYGEYLFYRKRKPAVGWLGFIFTKPKTDAERWTPIASRTKTEQRNHPWYPVVYRVGFYPDEDFAVSTNGTDGGIVLAARLYPRLAYKPGVGEGSEFRHEFYFSPTPFVNVQQPVPIPRAVQWKYHDSEGSFPECLGPRLVFPAIQSAFAAYSTGGGAVAAEGSAPGQIFPATNFEDWEEYMLTFTQEEVETGWEGHAVFVSPPIDQPDVITR
jgi:hypothetical protein